MIMKRMNKVLLMLTFSLLLPSCQKEMSCVTVEKCECINDVGGKLRYNDNLMQYFFVSSDGKYVGTFDCHPSFYDTELKKYCYSSFEEYGEYLEKFASMETDVYADFRTAYHWGKETCFVLPERKEIQREFPGCMVKSLLHLYPEDMGEEFYSSEFFDPYGIYAGAAHSIHGYIPEGSSDRTSDSD